MAREILSSPPTLRFTLTFSELKGDLEGLILPNRKKPAVDLSKAESLV
jgi:hypothetical protein